MSTAARFPGTVNTENTDRGLKRGYQAPAYAATITLAIDVADGYTLVAPAALTGAVTFAVNVGSSTTPPYVGDRIQFLLVSDGTTRTATFGTGFAPNGTLAITTAKYASIDFIFNGTAWIETGRTVTA